MLKDFPINSIFIYNEINYYLRVNVKFPGGSFSIYLNNSIVLRDAFLLSIPHYSF